MFSTRLVFLAGAINFASGFVYPRNVTNGTASSTEYSSVTLLYQNNLNSTDDVNHSPFLLLDPVKRVDAAAACASFSESLLPDSFLTDYADDLRKSLAYLAYQNKNGAQKALFVESGTLTFSASNQSFYVQQDSASDSSVLPVLCTQQQGNGTAATGNEVTVSASTNSYTGYRDQKSFRFLGIPYADPVARFQYSKPYSSMHQSIQATEQGSQCPQYGSGKEDCLFLSIYTPYLPKSGSTQKLKPVFFWIHGGGFTGGSGAQSDGGNLASREDILYVSINYRLSTLGFLAVPGTNVTGNYGIADQVTALEWTKRNIAAFGGDPDKITIVGESAGAGSVRTLLGSPKAIGGFRGAIAMSNLGGGVALGLDGDYSTTYSSYLTIDQSNAITQDLFTQAGCNQTTSAARIACLQTVPALDLVGYPTVARYVVQDGTYVDTQQLIVSEKNASTAHVPVMFGVMHDDGASVIAWPSAPVADESAGLQAMLNIQPEWASAVIASGLFPNPNSGNVTLDAFNVSSRVYTDVGFRCVDEATVYAGVLTEAFPTAYYYEFDRSIGGYDPNNVGNPPPSPGYPLGNPSLPYFKVHAGDVQSAFGTVSPNQIREPQDLYFAQLVSGYWSEFVRTLQPNPDAAYLMARGYVETLNATMTTGPWEPVGKGSKTGPTLALDWPSTIVDYRETEQCTWLNYTLSYYIDSNRG